MCRPFPSVFIYHPSSIHPSICPSSISICVYSSSVYFVSVPSISICFHISLIYFLSFIHDSSILCLFFFIIHSFLSYFSLFIHFCLTVRLFLSFISYSSIINLFHSFLALYTSHSSCDCFLHLCLFYPLLIHVCIAIFIHFVYFIHHLSFLCRISYPSGFLCFINPSTRLDHLFILYLFIIIHLPIYFLHL